MRADAKSYLEKGNHVNEGPAIQDNTQLMGSRTAWKMERRRKGLDVGYLHHPSLYMIYECLLCDINSKAE